VEIAVKRMLPKNSLGRAMFRKLKVYRGTSTSMKLKNRKN